jgi:hypothetical protein
MKIIQSFAMFENGSPYLNNDNTDKNKIYLNFYSFLLSFLTLKKYYNNVTMFCNNSAYNAFIRYIPYSDIKIVENSNSFELWNMYKIDSIKSLNEDFIHVDSDVFLFKDVYGEYISSNKYDVIVQDTIPPNINFIRNFVDTNKKILSEFDIFDSKLYDYKCVSCGTIGMNLKTKLEYTSLVDRLLELFNKNLLIDADPMSMIIEELVLHILITKNKLKKYEVLPYNQVLIHGVREVGNIQKYTHLWFNTKFDLKHIELIKNKIKKDFSQYYNYVEKYESDVLSNIKF